MGRRKKADPPFWITGRQNGKTEGNKVLPFVLLYADLLQDPAFTALPEASKLCYVAMSLECRGKMEFSFPRKTAERYGISRRTLIRCVDSLVSAGFIRIKSPGRVTRTESIYEFSPAWKTTEKAKEKT